MTSYRPRLTIDDLSYRANNLTQLQIQVIDESKRRYSIIKKLTIEILAILVSIDLIVSLYVVAASIENYVDFIKFLIFQYCALNIFGLAGLAVRIYFIHNQVLKPLLNTWTEVKQMGVGKKPLFFTYFLFFLGVVLFFICGPVLIDGGYNVFTISMTVWIFNCIIYSNFSYRYHVSSYLWKIIEHQNAPDAPTIIQC